MGTRTESGGAAPHTPGAVVVETWRAAGDDPDGGPPPLVDAVPAQPRHGAADAVPGGEGPAATAGEMVGGGGGAATAGACAVCRAPATQCCSGCRSVFYCGRDHQRQHWKAHRSQCLVYRVALNEQFGRHLVATRDIKAGEVVMQEAPLVVGPKVVTRPVCLGCLNRVSDADWHPCDGCGWSLCGADCEGVAQHTAECRLMRDKGFRAKLKFEQGKKESSFCTIVPLRCLLLKERDPAKYQSLISLESHLEERKNTTLYTIYRHNVVGFVRDVLHLSQFDEDTILTIAGVLDTNAFEIRRGGIKARGLYPTAALMAHDCTPNTKHVFKGSDFTMKVIATLPIKKGDIISTSYTQALWGTLARRSHLKLSKCFDCTCRRCADPTELGTYIGAISCSKCKTTGGISDPDNGNKIISTDPLDAAAPWKCENCSHTIPGRQMAWGNDAMKQEIDALDVSSPEALENFVEKYISALHPKNSYIIQAKYALSQIYGNRAEYELPELPEHLLNRKVELCHELLELADFLSPGMSTLRGLLLYDLQAAMVIQAKRDLENDKITKQNAQDIMGDAMKLLQEASEILRQEPEMADELQTKMENLAKELELE